MANNVLKIFPGANTPMGFFSFYDYFIDENELKNVFYIKGGSGLGKSTLIKKIGSIYDKYDNTVYFKCSADPKSLDGVLFENKRFAIVDGTFPHVSEPLYPGISGEVINLAEYLERKVLKNEKNNLMELSGIKQKSYKQAYMYLKMASDCYRRINEIYSSRSIKKEIVSTIEKIKLNIEKLYEETSIENYRPIRKAFISGITANGIVNEIDSMVESIDNIFIIESPAGLDLSCELISLAEWISSKGRAVWMCYCPMSPKKGVEHIFSFDLNVAIILKNEYHRFNNINSVEHFVIGENLNFDKGFCNIRKFSKSMIYKAIEELSKANEAHSEIEKIYGMAMNYSQIDATKNLLIEKIENIR